MGEQALAQLRSELYSVSTTNTQLSGADLYFDAVVAADGSGDYLTLQACLDAVPPGDSPYRIRVKAGRYEEKLRISRNAISLMGDGCGTTVISASTANGMLDENGRIWATRGSYTLAVDAQDFSASHLTIENGFDFPANQAKAVNDPDRITHTQAVALLIDERSDRARFEQVNLVSYHDTLYVRGGRSYFNNCRISGTVDFIFGPGTALFERCDLVARARADLSKDDIAGYVCAPSTSIRRPYGLVFFTCRLVKESEKVAPGSYGLGRPWHPTTQFTDGVYADPDAIGHALFIGCYMADHIYGWDRMHGRGKDGQLIWFKPEQSRFFESGSTGPGAEVNLEKRRQLNDQLAQSFCAERMLAGWYS